MVVACPALREQPDVVPTVADGALVPRSNPRLNELLHSHRIIRCARLQGRRDDVMSPCRPHYASAPFIASAPTDARPASVTVQTPRGESLAINPCSTRRSRTNCSLLCQRGPPDCRLS